MDKELRTYLLKKGGKKELDRYNRANRKPAPERDTRTRTFKDGKHKEPKYKEKAYEW